MPRPSCSPQPSLPPPVLDALTRHLAESHGAAPHAALVRVRGARQGPEVALCPLPEGVHPADALVGHTVPSSWSASGLVAPAGVRPLDRLDVEATPVVAAVVVSRTGHVAHHLTLPEAAASATSGEPPAGRLLDLLQRTIGLSTAPPAGPASEWWRAHWLDAVVTAAAADPRHVPRPEAPLTGVLSPDLVAGLVSEPGLCGSEGWSRLRALAAATDPPDRPGLAAVRRTVAPFVDPSMAVWMDDGCFARWLLSCLPPVDELLDLATALVPATTLEAIHRALGTSGPGQR